MKTIKIYGCSDDLIEIEGDLSEEFSYYSDDTSFYIGISDGTLIEGRYDKGIWRFSLRHQGTCEYHHDPNPLTDDDRYSDIVTLTGDIHWVGFVTSITA